MNAGDRHARLRLEAEAAIAADSLIPRAVAYLEPVLDSTGRDVLREVLVQAFLAGRVAALHDAMAGVRLERAELSPRAVALPRPALPVRAWRGLVRACRRLCRR